MKFSNLLIGRLYTLVLIAYAAIGYDLVTHTYGLYIWIPVAFVLLERIMLQVGMWLTQKMASEALSKILSAMSDGSV